MRLSREDGDKAESDSIANQKRIIDRYLERNPDINIRGIYIDDGFSGTNFDRPEVARLLGDMRSGEVNCIIVKDLSRFGRNYHETGQYIEVVFPLLKLRFISVNDNIDSFKNPSSIKNASVSFKNVMNDEYGRDISNKVKSTLTIKRKKGLFIGSFASYGYKKDPENRNKLIIDEEAAEIVRVIYQLFIGGMSVYNICRTLNQMGVPNPTQYKKSLGLNVSGKDGGEWVDRTVRRMLHNRLYVGDLIQRQMENVSYKVQVCRTVDRDKQIIVKNTHEPIIDIDTFDRVQELFKRDRRQPKGNIVGEVNIFAGYVKCADCGRAMQRRIVVQPYKTYRYFSCAAYRKFKQCTKHTIQSEKLEQAVLATLQKYVDMAVEMESLLDAINKSPVCGGAKPRLKKAVEIKEAEKARLTKLLNDLYPDYKEGLITKEQYLQFKSENEQKISDADAVLKTLNGQPANEENGIDNQNDFIASFKEHKNLAALTRSVITELIHMIYVEECGGIKVEFKFQDAFEQAAEYIEANKKLVV